MPPVTFVVTAFGSFCGVDENPTERLVDWVKREHAGAADGEGAQQDHHQHAYSIHSTSVIKVAAEDADSWISNAVKEVCSSCSSSNGLPDEGAAAPGHHHVVFLHLGVNVGGTRISLETQAFNNATFRCTDERGGRRSLGR